MSKSARSILLSESIKILIFGILVISVSVLLLQFYNSKSKVESLEASFIKNIEVEGDQIYLFYSLSKFEKLNESLSNLKDNNPGVYFCFSESINSRTLVEFICPANHSDLKKISFGIDDSLTIYFSTSMLNEFISKIYFTLLLSTLFFIFFTILVFRLRSKLSNVFALGLEEIADRLKLISIGNRQMFKSKSSITEIVKIEIELNCLVIRLNQLEEQIEDRVSRKFAKQIAHDIRSPVGALKMLFSVLNLQNESRDLAYNCLDRINDIASDILANDIVEKDFTSVKDTVDSIKLIQKEFQIRMGISKNFIFVKNNSLNTDVVIKTSKQIVERIFTILIQNSIDEVSSTDNLIIEILFDIINNDSISIHFMDNGPGFSNECLAKLSNFSFYNSNKNKEFSGHGLGLNFIIDNVHSISGQLSFRNKLTGGAIINIKLPISMHPTPQEPTNVPNLPQLQSPR